jgi:hypothetical protein
MPAGRVLAAGVPLVATSGARRPADVGRWRYLRRLATDLRG